MQRRGGEDEKEEENDTSSSLRGSFPCSRFLPKTPPICTELQPRGIAGAVNLYARVVHHLPLLVVQQRGFVADGSWKRFCVGRPLVLEDLQPSRLELVADREVSRPDVNVAIDPDSRTRKT